MVGLSRVTSLGRRVVSAGTEKNVTFMAAGLAYNAFVSLAPMLLILLVVVSVVGGGLESRFIMLVEQSLPGPVADVVSRVFQRQAGGSSASVIGAVVVLWGAFKIFRGLDVAFSEIYETEAMDGLVDTLKDGAVVFVALVLAALATIAASAAFSVFSGAFPYVGVLAPLVLVGGLVVAFLPMYYVFPDVEQHWQDTLPGVVFAAVGWAVFQALFQVYLLFKGGGASSLFGGVILVVTWLYFSGLVLLVGALINAVLNDHVTRTTDPSNAATTREETLRGDDIAHYLEDLRHRLSARYDGMASRDDERADTAPPEVDRSAEVVEYTSEEDDHRECTVQLRWRMPAGPSSEDSRTGD
jgi:membrane protein